MSITKNQIVIFIFFFLLAKRKYNIIITLLFVYAFFRIKKPRDKGLLEMVAQLSQRVDADDHRFFRDFSRLEKMLTKGQYPHSTIRREQLRILNQMLYLAPLSQTEQLQWARVRAMLLDGKN